MAFGSFAPNPMMSQGMQIMKMALDQRRAQANNPVDPRQGLLSRLLNPQTPPGQPTDLGASGMNANGTTAPMLPQFMQAGLLPKLLPGVFGGPGGPSPMGTMQPPVPPSNLPPIY